MRVSVISVLPSDIVKEILGDLVNNNLSEE
jgi:hypothetical protein